MRTTFILAEVFQNLRRNLFMVVSVVLVTFISLVFVGSSALIQLQIGKAKGDWYDKVQVAVWLCPDNEVTYTCPTGEGATDTDVEKIKDIINSELGEDVKAVDVITKAEAFEKFKKRYPGGIYQGKTLTEDDFQISMRLSLNNPENYQVVADVLTNRQGVQTVSDERQLFQSIFDTLNQLTIVAISLAVLMLISATLLIATTIRLSAASRWKETEIMRLVGASNWFIQLPFILEGVIAAVIGALLASGFIQGIVSVFIDGWIAQNNKFMEFVTTADSLLVFPLLIGVAVIIASVSSIVTLRKYLKV
ncbi:MAG: permease-like cell division protein FtsX [Candidatus Ancillula sp.]|jgi:cell division transport system permease protein|nr:permease-like cell division protein FtsX [Candidatus Ancillula sp.]